MPWWASVQMTKPIRSKRYLCMALAVVTVCWLVTDVITDTWTPLFLLSSALLVAFLLRKTATEKNAYLVESALDSFYESPDAVEYYGSYGAVIATEQVLTEGSKNLHVTQLCQTVCGRWFTLRFTTAFGSGQLRDLEAIPVSGTEASSLLSKLKR